jgi:hypothetical protein
MSGFLVFMGDVAAVLRCQKSNLEIKNTKFPSFGRNLEEYFVGNATYFHNKT